MLASVVLLVELPLWSLFICRQPTQTKRAIIVDGEPGAMQDDELVFDPYDASQLREILERRTDAFADSVLKGDVIPKVAALVAREHDDARKVVDTPYEAGRLAEKQGVEIPSITSTTPSSERRSTGSRNCSAGRLRRIHSAPAGAADRGQSRSGGVPNPSGLRTHAESVAHDGLAPLAEDRVWRL